MEESTKTPPVIIAYRDYKIWVFAQDDGIPVGTAVIMKNNIQVMSIPPSRFGNILLAESPILRYAEFWVDQHLRTALPLVDPLLRGVNHTAEELMQRGAAKERNRSRQR